MSSYQQRRVEYEVLEYNQGSGGAFGGASGFSAVKGGGYGGGAAGGYGAGGAGAGYGSCSSGGYGVCGGGYGAGGGGGFGAVGGGYGAAGGAYGAGGGGYGAGGGGYGGGGYGTAVGGGGGGYSSGFGGATKYSTSGGFDCGSGGYSQAQMYKNEVQTMAAKTGGGGGGYSSGFGGATEYSTGGGFDCGSGGYSQTQMYKNEVQTMAAKTGYGAGGDPFCSLVPSSFPPGTDPKIIDCFNLIDKDRSGQICDKELMAALSSFDQSFSLRTVHLLMYMFTGSNSKELGPKEFVPLIRSLQTWKATFQKFDCDRNGRLDERELKDALMSMGFAVSPFVIKLVMSKYDKSGYKCAIEYDYFIECCVVVKGLTEKFRAKEDDRGCGVASFTYDEFLLSVLPFIVA